MKTAIAAAGLLLSVGCQSDSTSARPEILMRVENVGAVDLPGVTLFLRENLTFGAVPAGGRTEYVRTPGGLDIVGVRVQTVEFDYQSFKQYDYIGPAPFREGNYSAKVTLNPQSRTVSLDLVRD